MGRRTAKTFENKITRWVWDGNTTLHEWQYDLKERPKSILDSSGMFSKDKEEPTDSTVTWVFDEGSFRPAAKIENQQSYSIVTDYLGTPCEAYNFEGQKVWEMELECYGKVKSCTSHSFVPFRFQGQYEDVETGLYYNRFRYYSAEEGLYCSQDPIGLAGGSKLYSYVKNPTSHLDVLGWEDIWYRALRKEDMTSLDSGNGIIPKDPTATKTPLEHVLHGSDDGYGDQYISLTKDKGLAERWGKDTEVAIIDLDKVSNTKLDLTKPEGRTTHLGDASRAPKGTPIWEANKKARGASELLVEGAIDNDAVVGRYKPSCK